MLYSVIGRIRPAELILIRWEQNLTSHNEFCNVWLVHQTEGMCGSSRNLMEKKFHITAPLDCHIQFPTVKEDSCSIAFEASKPSGSRL